MILLITDKGPRLGAFFDAMAETMGAMTESQRKRTMPNGQLQEDK